MWRVIIESCIAIVHRKINIYKKRVLQEHGRAGIPANCIQPGGHLSPPSRVAGCSTDLICVFVTAAGVGGECAEVPCGEEVSSRGEDMKLFHVSDC